MCDTLVTVTADGMIFGKNSDRDPNESQHLERVPARTHEPGSTVRCTHSTIPQVPRTHALLISRPWWMWGAEMGTNEHGVTIGNEAVFTRRADRGEPTGTELLGMDLLRLALERADTAAAAVEVIVTLLERHGQGGPCSHEHPRFTYDNSFIVADRGQAFVVETAGRRSAVEEVTGPGRSISNGLTITGFAQAHADPVKGRVAACDARRRRTEATAARAAGVADVLAGLRDHDGPAPRWSAVNGALSAPCAHAGGLLTSTQTTGSWIADLRGRPTHWVTGTSAPCLSLFVPEPGPTADQAPSGPPRGAATSGNRYDHADRWWHHEELHRLAIRDHGAALARFGDELDRVQRAWLAAPPNPVDAWEVADGAYARWADDLRAADLPDRRPAWLRALWRRWDRRAGMPVPAEQSGAAA